MTKILLVLNSNKRKCEWFAAVRFPKKSYHFFGMKFLFRPSRCLDSWNNQTGVHMKMRGMMPRIFFDYSYNFCPWTCLLYFLTLRAFYVTTSSREHFLSRSFMSKVWLFEMMNDVAMSSSLFTDWERNTSKQLWIHPARLIIYLACRNSTRLIPPQRCIFTYSPLAQFIIYRELN